jgi:hypothetical protein
MSYGLPEYEEGNGTSKRALTRDDMNALAQIARNFVEANERRNPEYQHPTLREREAFDSLRENVDSLVRNRRVS